MLFKFINALSGDGDMLSLMVQVFVVIFVVFCILPVHEFAHAFAAYKLGDETARLKGRLTLSPKAHIDPMGALMILFFSFGYAKPVPVNIHNLKTRNKKFGMALVAFAGPLSNIILSFIFLIIANTIWAFNFNSYTAGITIDFFKIAAIISVNLAVFNLLPIPPLDGSRLLSAFIPDKFYYKLMQYERYIFIAVIILLFTNVLTKPLSFFSQHVFNAVQWVAGLPFLIFR